MCMPIFVSALETDSYIHYDNIKTGGEDFNGMSWGNNEVEITMKDLSEYSFDLKGYNLEEDETYVLELKSDFVDFSKEYTGQELLDFLNSNEVTSQGLMPDVLVNLDGGGSSYLWLAEETDLEDAGPGLRTVTDAVVLYLKD